MQAKDIMSKEVLTVTSEMSVKELAKFFLENKISGAPVMRGECFVGMVEEEDVIFHDKQMHLPTVVAIFDAVIYLDSPKNFEEEMHKVLGEKVEAIMKKDVARVTDDASISEIATLMTNKKTYLIPVFNDEKLVGIIGKADIMRAITQEMEQ